LSKSGVKHQPKNGKTGINPWLGHVTSERGSAGAPTQRLTKRGASARWVKSAGGGSGRPDAATTSEGGDGDQRKAEAGTRKGRIRPAGGGSSRRPTEPVGGRWRRHAVTV